MVDLAADAGGSDSGDGSTARTFGEFLTDDLAAMGDEELMKLIVNDDAELAFITARQALVANELQRRRSPIPTLEGTGTSPSLGRWLAARSRSATRTAGRVVADGRRLAELPEVTDALLGGAIGTHHLRRIATAFNDDRTTVIAAESTICEWARTLEWPEFDRRLTALLELMDDTDPADAALRAHNKRGLDSVDLGDTVDYGLTTTPEARAIFDAAIAQRAKVLKDRDWADLRAAHGDDACWSLCSRNDRQRRHDALLDLVRAGAAELDPTGSFVVDVVMDHDTFLREADAWLDDLEGESADRPKMTPREAAKAAETFASRSLRGHRIAPIIAFRMALAGHIRRVLYDGPTTKGSRKSRGFVGLDRVLTQIRHPNCTEPGCDAPSVDCEIDHVTPDSRGGPTTTDNAEPKCRKCHQWKTLMETLGIA
ncbi:MAG: DUF222 domain-containing protein [Acidimicrobiales bacterium]